ncbi:hypothetical protein ACP70R_046101 [Stipagrostis hirtigluma subsp. patula]
MEAALPASRKRSRCRRGAAGTAGVADSTRGTIRERQQRRRTIIQAKKEGNSASEQKQVVCSGETSYYGPPAHECQYCGAQFWYQERVKRSYSGEGHIRFHLCCRGGKVSLPFLKDPPPFLAGLLNPNGNILSKYFLKSIRSYNSMFAFTSLGAKIDTGINKSPGPYVFKINGQVHHRIGSLLPDEGEPPVYAQLYIFDTENEVQNRISIFDRERDCDDDNGVDKTIVEGLVRMFDETNELVKSFRAARDLLVQSSCQPLRLRLLHDRSKNAPQYNAPTGSEIAALIVGDFSEEKKSRDIIIQDRGGGLRRISNLHANYMALQYPLLFPYGEQGFKLGIKYSRSGVLRAGARNEVTMLEYYAFRLQQRRCEGVTLISGDRLFQQYIVDAYASVEENRLRFIVKNNNNLRSEIYKGIEDALHKGDVDGNNVGKKVILPASFTGSKRYMVQNYQDAMAIWQRPDARPDIVSRVFKLKVEELVSVLKKGTYFGKAQAVMDQYSLLSQINPTRHNWRIKVRVARLWRLSGTSKGKGFTTVELILVDEEGHGITACIGQKDIDKFTGSIVEGRSYFIRNFQVSSHPRKISAVPNTYTIYFTSWTVIEEIPAEASTALPLHIFNFVDFEDLDPRSSALVDVIGQLTVVHPIIHSNSLNGPSVRRIVELRDLIGRLLLITLWGEYATSFEDEFLIETIGKDEPVVIIFAGMQVKLFSGAPSCRSGPATKWYINIDIAEVNAFHASLQGRGAEVVLLPGDGDDAAADDENANRKSVSELLSLNPHDNNGVRFTCHATIREIDVTNGWWYKGCSICKRGLKPTLQGFECTNCNETEPVVVPSYKLNVVIEDSTGRAKIFMFGGVAEQVVRWTAAELVEESSSNQILLPAALRALVGRRYVFQLVISEQTFRTGQLCFQARRLFTPPAVAAVQPSGAHVTQQANPGGSALAVNAATGKDPRASCW